MKNLLLIVFIFCTNWLVYAQSVQPLYIKFEGNQIGFRKLENIHHLSIIDDTLKEDSYDSIYPLVGGFPLELITYNKRDYVEINQSELSNYNVKNIQEIKQMMATKTEIEQLDFWGQLHEQKKLYVIEILPNNKAKIVKVWVAPH